MDRLRYRLSGDEADERIIHAETADQDDDPSMQTTDSPGKCGSDPEDNRVLARRVILKAVGYTALIVAVMSFVIGLGRIQSNDMAPAFVSGDLVVTFKLGGYSAGDVVFYRAGGEKRCGRITAVAGDEVMMMEDGYYSINGSIPYENIYYPTKAISGGISYPYRVDEDKVFIMGDMRQQSIDSRKYGAIPIKDIKGKIVLLLFRGRGF